MERRNYEALAHDVKLADITSDVCNYEILQRLCNHQYRFYDLDIDIAEHINNTNNDQTFDVDKISDIGWLGYYVGKSRCLKTLWIGSWGEGEKNIEAFIEGLSYNRSIEKLHFCADVGDVPFQRLSPFFRNNSNLAELKL